MMHPMTVEAKAPTATNLENISKNSHLIRLNKPKIFRGSKPTYRSHANGYDDHQNTFCGVDTDVFTNILKERAHKNDDNTAYTIEGKGDAQ